VKFGGKTEVIAHPHFFASVAFFIDGYDLLKHEADPF
jgi:hypothetical protein